MLLLAIIIISIIIMISCGKNPLAYMYYTEHSVWLLPVLQRCLSATYSRIILIYYSFRRKMPSFKYKPESIIGLQAYQLDTMTQ